MKEKPSSFASWIEAMRLRTLPVSIAGVLMGCGLAEHYGDFRCLPAILCLMFAVLAQISSNFANEYFDFRNGLDRKGRDGFRRGVTEGDISPDAMKRAVIITLLLAAACGLWLVCWSGWWLIIIGVIIGIFALAYSAGPYPLSHHGLGDIAVIIFFGFVPVMFTAYLQCGPSIWNFTALCASFSVGFMAANVLIVNNYRDMDDDNAVCKNTTVVRFGRPAMSRVYLLFGFIAIFMMYPIWISLPYYCLPVPMLYFAIHITLFIKLRKLSGRLLNPLLGKTAMNMFVYCILTTLMLFLN